MLKRKYLRNGYENPQGQGKYEERIKRILIADGSRLLRELIKKVIIDHYNCVLTSEASNEREVFDELCHYPFDIILLDLGLLEDKGLNLLKKILIADSNIHVLILSLLPDEQYEEYIYRAGCSGYISKINLVNELILALEEISNGKRYFRYLGRPSEKE